ncbi:MAG: glycosyltransferase family 4 protein [Candidatus Lokiarchaeia archaeon]
MLCVQITLSYFSHGAVMRRSRQETRALLNAGHRVIIITDLRWKSAYSEMEEFKDKLLIIPIKPIYIYRIRSISCTLSFSFKAYYALKKLVKKESIDLIVIHASIYSFAIARFAKKNNIPTAWVMHELIRDRATTGNPYNRWETILFMQADFYSFSKINFLIALAKYHKKFAILDGANSDKIYIKYNPINTLEFHPLSNVSKDIDILFIGRLSIEKGIDILIESTKYISKNRKIIIIGDGILKKPLEDQAKQTNFDIDFKGFIKHELLPNYINRAKILVAPSRSEAHAVVPLEAMACGTPVIASRVSGMEDSIQNKKNGWLLDKNNSKTLGTLIEKVLNNEENLKVMSKAALKRSESFSEKRFSKDIVEFYEMVVRKYNIYKKF